MSVVLVDMDGVVADWGARWDALLDEFGAGAARIRRHRQQTSFNLHEGCTATESAIVDALMDEPGFYLSLEPIDGAIDALEDMRSAGHDVYLVTSPWVTNPTCASDKLAWVARHLGHDWPKHVVITSDKTLVQGDYIIDDKPAITGSQAPSWEHIWFTQPYNSQLTGQRRLDDWSQWKDMIR